MAQDDSVKMSFDKDGLIAIKKAVTRGKPYHERISIALAIRLANAFSANVDAFSVLDEIDYLEGIKPTSRTKEEAQFKRPPLQGLWHKHFFSPKHLVKNIGVRWNLDNGGNKGLSTMISEIQKKHGQDPDVWPSMLAHRLVMGGFEERAARGLTGDWIIYAKHENNNFYLDLATHEEGLEPEQLLQKLRNGCNAEFPFIFDDLLVMPPALPASPTIGCA
jgi:hypothetical protein